MNIITIIVIPKNTSCHKAIMRVKRHYLNVSMYVFFGIILFSTHYLFLQRYLQQIFN